MYVGIDPGARGAFVGINRKNEVKLIRVMPTHKVIKGKRIRNECSIPGIIEAVRSLRSKRRLTKIAMEKQWPRPTDGKVQAWSFSAGYHAILTALECEGLSVELISPATWTKRMRSDYGKQGSIEYVQRMLPDLDLMFGRMRKPHDGIAEAACMALYAREFL